MGWSVLGWRPLKGGSCHAASARSLLPQPGVDDGRDQAGSIHRELHGSVPDEGSPLGGVQMLMPFTRSAESASQMGPCSASCGESTDLCRYEPSGPLDGSPAVPTGRGTPRTRATRWSLAARRRLPPTALRIGTQWAAEAGPDPTDWSRDGAKNPVLADIQGVSSAYDLARSGRVMAVRIALNVAPRGRGKVGTRPGGVSQGRPPRVISFADRRRRCTFSIVAERTVRPQPQRVPDDLSPHPGRLRVASPLEQMLDPGGPKRWHVGASPASAPGRRPSGNGCQPGTPAAPVEQTDSPTAIRPESRVAESPAVGAPSWPAGPFARPQCWSG